MPKNNFSQISFYVVAHADDWQLFMCPNVYNDITRPNTKVVIIITTAGDAGMNEKYWMSREEGAKSSLRFCIALLKNFSQTDGVKEFNAHPVYYWNAVNTIFYFLRLPDGNLTGEGFSSNNFQSLSKLKLGSINSITAINNSTAYNNWTDFYTTVETIITTESNNIAERRLNYINPDETINSYEHADHVVTGNAIQCMKITSTTWQALYKGYNLNNAQSSISNTDLFWKAGMFAVYDKAVFDHSGYSTLKEDVNSYINWCLSSAQPIIIKPIYQ